MRREQTAGQAQSSHARRRILQATVQLYREIGHKKTTVADIARRSAMSPANVYRFFRSKRQIEEVVVAEALDGVFQAAATAVRGSGSPVDGLDAAIRAIAELHEGRRADDKRLHELVAEASEANWPVVLAYIDRVVGLLASLIAAGQARGEIRDGSAATLACCLFAAMNAHLRAGRVSVAAVGATLDETLNFCIHALCPPPFIAGQSYSSCADQSRISAAGPS
jgi:AcrR family transcriptional regulator